MGCIRTICPNSSPQRSNDQQASAVPTCLAKGCLSATLLNFCVVRAEHLAQIVGTALGAGCALGLALLATAAALSQTAPQESQSTKPAPEDIPPIRMIADPYPA